MTRRSRLTLMKLCVPLLLAFLTTAGAEGFASYRPACDRTVDPQTFQNAIQGPVDDLGVICLSAGTYAGNVNITHIVVLVGAGRDATVIDGKGTTDMAGIEVSGGAHVIIEGVGIRNFREGVLVRDSAVALIKDSLITDNTYGLLSEGFSWLLVESSELTGNVFGISVSSNSRATIHNNTIKNNKKNGIDTGIWEILGCYGNTVANNLEENYYLVAGPGREAEAAALKQACESHEATSAQVQSPLQALPPLIWWVVTSLFAFALGGFIAYVYLSTRYRPALAQVYNQTLKPIYEQALATKQLLLLEDRRRHSSRQEIIVDRSSQYYGYFAAYVEMAKTFNVQVQSMHRGRSICEWPLIRREIAAGRITPCLDYDAMRGVQPE